jgi:ABC-type multidrug transport system ATPase subunit
LSVAIQMLSHPAVLFCDEPTTGMEFHCMTYLTVISTGAD